MNREYHKWWSSSLSRDMELLVFGHSGAKMLVFPTRGGRFFEYENMRMTDQLRHKIEEGHLQLYCIDGIDSESIYCNWAHPTGRINRHQEYENYILDEVIPFMDHQNPHETRISHGCSLGAYFAANLAFRHPHLFKKLVAFSGRYDLTMSVEDFRDLFDGYYDENIYFHNPSHFLPGIDREEDLKHLREMDIIFTIGEHDPFLGNNRNLSNILYSKGIDHQFHVWQDRAHRGYYWRRMVRIYV